MKHKSNMNSHKYITFYLLFSSSVLFLVEGRSTPVPPEATSISQIAESHVAPEGRQGILEIPKQAATAIRNFLDQGIRYYLGVTTPPTSPNVPPELQNSIVGNFLLGNLQATLPPAPAYNPQLPGQLTVVQPITASKDPSYYGHSPTVVFVKKTTPAPPAPPKTEPPPPPSASEPQGSKNKQRVRPTGEKVHILDTDTSFNAIFNGLQVSGGVVPKLPPLDLTSAEAPEPAPVPKPVDTINKYKPTSTVDKIHVHVLDTDTTLDGIYSMFGLQLSANSKPKPPQEVPATVEVTTEPTVVIEAITEKATDGATNTKKPVKYNPGVQFIETDSFLSNPYGITVNKNPDDETEQNVPETTKASIIIPIQTSTTKAPVKASTTEQSSVEGAIVVIPEEPAEITTEEGAVEATTEDEDEEGLREMDGVSTTKVPVTTTAKAVTVEGAPVETTTEDEDEEGLGEEDGENKDITTKAPVTTTTKQVTGESTVETATEDDEEEGRGDEDGSKRKYIFDILE